jgi:deazaflavin-dependent oxidoreductase (nitroreductase family)
MVAETNAGVIAEFRANGGVVAAPYPDPPPMLLVHTTGRRSGKEHITPMRCLPEDDHWYIFGSAHGSDRHPDWYLNLVVKPDITIEVGRETVPVRATVMTGADRDEVFARQVARFPYFGELQARLSRVIPVVRLDRCQE